MDDLMKYMIEARNMVAKQVVAMCQPEIAAVCHLFEEGKQVSEETLESLFDRLLDHCYDDEVKKLFTELSRAAEKQHRSIVQDYAKYYNDLWGEE